MPSPENKFSFPPNPVYTRFIFLVLLAMLLISCQEDTFDTTIDQTKVAQIVEEALAATQEAEQQTFEVEQIEPLVAQEYQDELETVESVVSTPTIVPTSISVPTVESVDPISSTTAVEAVDKVLPHHSEVTFSEKIEIFRQASPGAMLEIEQAFASVGGQIDVNRIDVLYELAYQHSLGMRIESASSGLMMDEAFVNKPVTRDYFLTVAAAFLGESESEITRYISRVSSLKECVCWIDDGHISFISDAGYKDLNEQRYFVVHEVFHQFDLGKKFLPPEKLIKLEALRVKIAFGMGNPWSDYKKYYVDTRQVGTTLEYGLGRNIKTIYEEKKQAIQSGSQDSQQELAVFYTQIIEPEIKKLSADFYSVDDDARLGQAIIEAVMSGQYDVPYEIQDWYNFYLNEAIIELLPTYAAHVVTATGSQISESSVMQSLFIEYLNIIFPEGYTQNDLQAVRTEMTTGFQNTSISEIGPEYIGAND